MERNTWLKKLTGVVLVKNIELNNHKPCSISVTIDITSNTSELKTLIENRLKVNLNGYTILNQDEPIIGNVSMSELCFPCKGKVIVRVNIRHKTKHINIVDVKLKNGHRNNEPLLFNFLYSLLNDPAYFHIIQWTNGRIGQFKMVDATAVATEWGRMKKNENMKYSIMSRAMRDYYKKNIMEKVKNKKFEYRFTNGFKMEEN